MTIREPVAFLSYVRSDDEHDWGRITKLRQRLEGEVKIQTGRPFAIFQDRNDIIWGQQWAEVIRSSLAGVTFLIPVITPSFFVSPACRSEFKTFLLREKTVGTDRLILPLYYVACDQFDDGWQGDDPIAKELRKRNWTDWRSFRFSDPTDSAVGGAVAALAAAIKTSIRELETEIRGASARRTAPARQATSPSSIGQESSPTRPFAPVAPELRAWRKKPSAAHFAQVRADHDYYVYTKRFDEELPAHTLSPGEDALRLYHDVSKRLRVIERRNAKEPLMVPPARLFSPKRPSCAATLLVDNSGSLKQEKYAVPLAAWCTIISQWFDAADIPSEVLGFTTRAWKGGQARELWLKDGKPNLPGRLNDLRHIIYKSFTEDARTAAPNIAVMTREGILKENIDGEALLWAAGRLEAQDVERRFLFVLSDGAPVDDSTLAVNAGNFLERHLLAVIKWLSTRDRLTVVAVGLGHDVSRYYPNSFAEADPDRFGLPVLEAISRVLKAS